MPILNISEFSCLEEATFDLAPVNVIIGPQGSGKSITIKLFYFFSDILSSYIQSAERGDSIDEYKRLVAKQFCSWFPPSAWGPKRFNINYSAGDFSVRVLRRKIQNRLGDEVSVAFSEWFSSLYSRSRQRFQRTAAHPDFDIGTNSIIMDSIDQAFHIRSSLQLRVTKDLGYEYIRRQTYVPAGRAFFTSIGRLVAGLEQAGSLDPITIKFAQLFANIRDHNSRQRPFRLNRLGDEFKEKRYEFMRKLFGGEVRFQDDAEYVQTEDGRKIPFLSLSSGQQELLPMWSLIDYFNQRDALASTIRNHPLPRELIYIEEPEAHLFPSAQSLLMEFLISSVAPKGNFRSLIITTHSPYIMSKLNVFLKAGQLARHKKRNQDINEVVSRDCWLNERQLSAFAIQDGKLRDIIDEDDFIDGRYLDEISEEISRDFSRLLKIESEM